MAKVNLGTDTSGRPLVVDATWLAKLRAAEARLGFRFTVVQGSYRGNAGAAASANTHRLGGVADVRSWDIPKSIGVKKAVRILRECGLIAWYRTKAQGFDPHIHAIDYGNPNLDPSAARQVTAWENGRNGLASNGPDDGPRVNIPKEAPVMAARIDGVDISHWQAGALNFTKAKAAGVRWVFHKATEGWGASGSVDARYNSRRVEVHKAGLLFGAYHFARPRSSNGKAQAAFFLSTANPRAGDMRPMLDLEDTGGLGKVALTRWVGDFVGEVIRQTGEPPFIYTKFDLNNNFDCPLWVPRYSNAMNPPVIPAPWKSYTVWQFSDGVFGVPKTVPGLGAVDINTMNGDPAALTKAFTLGADKKPTPQTQEEDMPLTDADIQKIAKAVASWPVANKTPGEANQTGSLGGMVTRVDYSIDQLATAVTDLTAKVDALQAAVDAGKAPQP